MFWIVLGNIFSFMEQIGDAIGTAIFHEKRKLIMCNCITTVIGMIGLFCLQTPAGIINYLVTILRLLSIQYKDSKNKSLTWLFVLISMFYTLSFLDYHGIYTWLLFIGTMVTFVTKWFSSNIQVIRFGVIGKCVLLMPYFLSIYNYAAFAFCIFGIITSLIGLYRYNKSHTTDLNTCLD